jgi:tricorn protease
VRPVLSVFAAFVLTATLAPAPAIAQAPPAAAAPEGETRLLRYPDVYRETIVFVYAGDLWTVPAVGGMARRLTSHPGEELFPKFSPDGRLIAFTGQYSGTRQVFTIPTAGGTPRQLTFYNDAGALPPRGGVDNQVLGWTPDGEHVLFNAHRTPWSDRIGRPHKVPAAGGMEEPLPMPESATGDISPDGTRWVFPPIMREFRTWKRYRGGRAQDLWIYDLAKNTSERITDFEGTDNQPVWVGDTIYFTSDRTGRLQLYAWDVATRTPRQVTDHDPYDVLWPSGGPDSVVYENGGWIFLFDPASGASRKVPVRVYGDFEGTVPYFKKVKDDIQSWSISPTGKRAVFGARGEVFTVPAEHGEPRNLTGTPGVREMDASWSPDGRWIAYLSDATGEYEVYLRPADGTGEARRLTTDGDIWRFPPAWSPDSKKLAFGDKRLRLRYVEVESGRVVDADRGTRGDITDYRWSPDSRWLAYTKAVATQLPSIWVYSLDEQQARQLTSDATAEFEPVWDPEGRYLYFLSNRDHNLTFSGYEFDYVYTDPTRVYVAVLRKDGPALFLPKSDEEAAAAEKKDDGARVADAVQHRHAPPARAQAEAAEEKAKGEDDGEGKGEEKDAAAKKKPVRVAIDFDGFEARVRAVPGPSGNYRNLAANAKGVFYLTGDGPRGALKTYDLEAQKEEGVLDGVQAFELSADGKKLLYRKGDEDFGIVAAAPGQKESKLALDAMEVKVEPRAEWRQMFDDAWRLMRDWFYDAGLHGVDWPAMRERYGVLVPHVARRADLDFILGELLGELNAGHAYVQSSDDPAGVERVPGGLLGAVIEPHPSGAFRIAKIYPGENWHADYRSPLTEPGVRVAEGDFILAVDGVPTKGIENFYRLLEHKADRVVALLVNGRPATAGARLERVRPIASEIGLRYLAWVEGNRRKVAEASGGRIGYLHLPDTAVAGNRELFKHFYPQVGKDALIVDVRYNGGGFIPDRMAALLARPVLNYWLTRSWQLTPTPAFAHQGPKVALINGQAGSGGDAFPYYFRKLGLGPLIGTRTWGGLIGLSGNPSLLDGGAVTVPTFRFVDTEGRFAVEGVGVAPDIEVIDAPHLVAQGRDPSLEKGVEVLMDELARNPPKRIEPLAPWREPGSDRP